MYFSFFDTSVASVEKYVENVSKFILCRKIRRKYLNKHSGKWIARLKYNTALLYKYQTYINSYSGPTSALETSFHAAGVGQHANWNNP